MRDMAKRNDACARKKPSTEAPNILGRSRSSTLSLGRKIEISQNNAPAPIERREKSANGDIAPLVVSSLHTTILSPNIRYAVKQARWPIMVLLFIIICALSCKDSVKVVKVFGE